jgi:hypothetical protein
MWWTLLTFHQVLFDYDIPMKKVSYFVTDNGSNIVKAFKKDIQRLFNLQFVDSENQGTSGQVDQGPGTSGQVDQRPGTSRQGDQRPGTSRQGDQPRRFPPQAHAKSQEKTHPPVSTITIQDDDDPQIIEDEEEEETGEEYRRRLQDAILGLGLDYEER